MRGFIPIDESPNTRRAASSQNRMKADPKPNFILAHHPDNWQINGRGELTPCINHLAIQPGVNGTDAYGDSSGMELWAIKQGFKLIPHDILPGGRDYAKAYLTTFGHRHHRTVFEHPERRANGSTKWVYQQADAAAFIAYLRSEGVIEPPRAHIVQELIDQVEREIEFLDSSAPSKSDGRRWDRYLKRVTARQTALDTLRLELEQATEHYAAEASPSELGDSLRAAVRAAVAEKKRPAKKPATRRTRKSKGGSLDVSTT